MISGEMLDYLDQIARAVRGDGNPFGGLQVRSAVFIGIG